MERKLTTKVQEHMYNFKTNIISKLSNHVNIDEIVCFINEYPIIEITTTDLTKRKRVKNTIAQCERCTAKRANGEQCSRRKLSADQHFCGTHIKGTPNGVISNIVEVKELTEKVNLFIKEINGIFYYLDIDGNVYKHEDVLQNKFNPEVIAKYEKHGGIYSIPELNI